MIDPRVALIVLCLAGGYYVGAQAVHGAKVVGHKIVHVLKKAI